MLSYCQNPETCPSELTGFDQQTWFYKHTETHTDTLATNAYGCTMCPRMTVKIHTYRSLMMHKHAEHRSVHILEQTHTNTQ